jgi:GTP-binding protein HflX
LEEINEADLILHVIDITHPHVYEQNETVMETLAELGVVDRPVLVALNKIDRLPSPERVNEWLLASPNSVAISAAKKTGLENLLEQVGEVLAADMVYVALRVPYDRGDLTARFHEQATMVKASHDGQGTMLRGYLPRRWLGQFRSYLV